MRKVATTIGIAATALFVGAGCGSDEIAQELKKLTESSPALPPKEVDQIRGRSPMQFTFDFRWNEGAKSEN